MAAAPAPLVDVDDSMDPPPPQHSEAPRRGSRVKKPTRKALGEEPAAVILATSAEEFPDSKSSKGRATRRSSRTTKPEMQPSQLQQQSDPDGRGKIPARPARGSLDAALRSTIEDPHQDASDTDDDNEYCICRGRDDGTPMISCEACHDWFHFSCVSLTKAAARKLSEYLCPSCKEAAEQSKDDDKKTRKTASKNAGSEPATNDDEDRSEKTSPPESAATETDSEGGSEHVEDGQEADKDEDEDEDIRRGSAQASWKRPIRDSYRALKRRRSSGAGASEVDATKSARRSSVSTSSPTRSKHQGGQPAAKVSRTKAEGRDLAAQSKKANTSGTASRSSPSRRTSLSASKDGKASGPRKWSVSGTAAGPSRSREADLGEVEAARAPARRVIAAVLATIFTSTSLAPIENAGGTISLDLVEQSKAPQERASDYAEAFEQEMFNLTAEQSHSRSAKAVGQKYREKFRTFLFSLKDKHNQGLHLRIASGQLRAKDLAHMSKDELANESIRLATEKAKQEALHRITLLKTEDGPHRKITHKGEIEIDSDSFSVKDQGGKFTRAAADDAADTKSDTSPKAKASDQTADDSFKMPRRPSSMSRLDPPSASSGPSDATSAPPSTRQGDGAEAAIEVDVEGYADSRSPPTFKVLSSTLLQSPATKFDFSSVWSGPNALPSSGIDGGVKRGEAHVAERFGLDEDESGGIDVFQPDFPSDVGGSQGNGSPFANTAAAGDADDFIDTFLGGAVGDGQDHDPSASTLQVPEARTPEPDPPSAWLHRYRPVLWTGALVLPDVGYFMTVSRQIAGQDVTNQPWVWPYFFPTSQSIIEGRLPSKPATDYLLQVRNSPKTKLVVFTLEARFDPIAVAPADCEPVRDDAANTSAFAKMVEHFRSLDRWGVLHKSTRGRDSGILKDMYLVPLRKDDPVPVWLDVVEPDALGQEWSLRRDRDLFLIPMVIYSGAIEAEAKRLSKSKRKTPPSAGVKRSANATLQPVHFEVSSVTRAPAPVPASGPTPTPSSIAAETAAAQAAAVNRNGITTTALQDLLRSIGKSTSSLLDQQATPPYPNLPTTSEATPWSPMPPQQPRPTSASPSSWSPMHPPPPGPAPRPPTFLTSSSGAGSGTAAQDVAGGAGGFAAWDAERPPPRGAPSTGTQPAPRGWPEPPASATPLHDYGGGGHDHRGGGPPPRWGPGPPPPQPQPPAGAGYPPGHGRPPSAFPPSAAQGSPYHVGEGRGSDHGWDSRSPPARSDPPYGGSEWGERPHNSGPPYAHHGWDDRAAQHDIGSHPPQHHPGPPRGGRAGGGRGDHGWGRGRGRC